MVNGQEVAKKVNKKISSGKLTEKNNELLRDLSLNKVFWDEIFRFNAGEQRNVGDAT